MACHMLCLVTQPCPTLCHPWTVAARLLCPWCSPGKNPAVGSVLSSRDLPHPGIELGCPALQADSLPAELPGKPVSQRWRICIWNKQTSILCYHRRGQEEPHRSPLSARAVHVVSRFAAAESTRVLYVCPLPRRGAVFLCWTSQPAGPSGCSC